MAQSNFPIEIWEVEGIYEYLRKDAKWLYDLDDVENEPNGYWLALKLNRNKKTFS